MGDEYKGNQVGAMGPGATATHVTMIQTSGLALSPKELASDLDRLRAALKREASSLEHDEAVGAVAAAQKAAAAGNSSAAVEHLKLAGRWALDVAEKIGVGVATAAIKTALGL